MARIKKTASGYDSKFEESYAKTLDSSWQHHGLRLTYVTKPHTYTPDFVDHANKVVRETKGKWDSADRTKIKLVKEQNPDWKIIMVFQDPNKTISKASKTTYAMYCDKLGIEWEHFIPTKETKNANKPKRNKPNQAV